MVTLESLWPRSGSLDVGLKSPPQIDSRLGPWKIVILGLPIFSSSANGHAAYRGLVRELAARGHDVLCLEREASWHAANQALPKPPFGRLAFYSTVEQLRDRFATTVRRADLVIVGCYEPQGATIGTWVTKTANGVKAFYDRDTTLTIASLDRGNLDYLSADLIPRYDIYLSFTGGGILERLREQYGSPMAQPLYCSVDPTLYFPENRPKKFDLGYMGAYREDRQPALDELLLQVARDWQKGRFVIAGTQYPRNIRWPKNVVRHPHFSGAKRRDFYNSQRFTLNITRTDAKAAGYSPSVRLFEAAACGTPILSDCCEGLDALFEPHKEILITSCSEESLYYLLETSEAERCLIGKRARARVLSRHTVRHRAMELEAYVAEVLIPARHDSSARKNGD
jgi:spore maturation protein CgeB